MMVILVEVVWKVSVVMVELVEMKLLSMVGLVVVERMMALVVLEEMIMVVMVREVVLLVVVMVMRVVAATTYVFFL